jgi:hypothetical protein
MVGDYRRGKRQEQPKTITGSEREANMKNPDP